MAMGARWAMTTATNTIHMRDDQLLTLAQWLSPSYPVGAFAWSHGLEAAVARDEVTDSASLMIWLRAVLEHGAGRSDAILLCAAHDAEDPGGAAELAAVLAPSRERRAETLSQGAAFAATTRAVWGLDVPDMAFPVAVGRAARLMGLPKVPTAQLWLQAFVSNLTQVAQRLMPIGQTEGQRILHQLTPLCARLGIEAADSKLDDLGSSVFAVDVAAMRHETQEVRLFRS